MKNETMDRSLLFRYFEGQASEEEIRRIREWESLSAENASYLREERKLHDILILSKEPARADAARRGGRRWIAYAVSAAASLLLVSVLWLSLRQQPFTELAQNVITVPAGQRVNVRLPDGTDAWLNGGTTLTYPARFEKGRREISLDGEALLEVFRDEKAPFVVKTHAGDVSVLGTRFDVEASASRQVFVTSLLSGKVQVQLNGDTDPVTLSPGQEARLEGSRLVVSPIGHPEVFRWSEGLYCFTEKTFRDILSDLERFYEVDIELQYPAVQGISLTGKFRISDGPETALRVLQGSFPFHYTKDNNHIVIFK